MNINCRGQNLILHKERAIYWEAQQILIVSDLHIGKSAHFRKHGIQVPATVGLTDLHRLNNLMTIFSPKTLLVTGDMFHNNINSDANAFMQWRTSYPDLKVILVKGNHDNLKNEDYEALGIEVHHKEFLQYPFRFIHDKPVTYDAYYNISGHIHPGVILYGKARQRLKFPCFYFGLHCAVLPAFSVFTGLKLLTAAEGDRFYAITPEKVIEI
ncbi:MULTISPECIES: ligase-associated DNA damage response endonuclease PdeM [Pedobacter]|uniref:ICC-like putative phosphoesterase n=1 Tax=Pedobacter heparinus (strain ATCC 13125 / DSM 2366 / CIP 104194 / JCM 7457 / NBRC 12017 / NCIMB 9290 / NRRL B-14731 / HIM 762-3) TaxID=485917 RepID=C6Y056_PEDHD|nr:MULTISPECIES: ligase-associated DNA damage response endonuclease PdeM [Pedobacter]ACU04768.1 ICC-like putative phosphoesterase [Pedobacter heparinus DSM 2366]MBB5437381.1 DNA ligase-associated metallophosphoesterase [Pedobacter sp. AK017]